MKKLPCRWAVDAGYVSNETLAGMFDLDWKVSPEAIMTANGFAGDTQLTPGQVITLPAPGGFEG